MAKIAKNRPQAFDAFLSVATEALAGEGEDSYAHHIGHDRALIAVFDGCGGRGAQKYERYEQRTGAYIAAHMAASAVLRWYDGVSSKGAGLRPAEPLRSEVQCALQEEMKNLAESAQSPSLLTGSMVRRFPTTAAIALIDRIPGGGLDALFLWAGDSRGYALTPEGLVQLTKDELRGEPDAMDNLYADAPMSNCVSADGAVTLQSLQVHLPAPCIAMVATDGAFGYLPSPMHFELLLLEALCGASSPGQCEDTLTAQLKGLAGDDCTLLMAAHGWRDYPSLKRDFQPRLEALRALLRGRDGIGALREIWAEYRLHYEGSALSWVK